jgi:hypothetical protein
MKGEMGVMTRYEVEKLMGNVSRQRARVIREFCTKAYALEVGEEMFQCHIACLPDAPELRSMLNDKSSTMKFKVWQTVNGIMIRREA